MNEENKVIHLSHYLKNNQKIESVNLDSKLEILDQPEANRSKRVAAFAIDFFAIAVINSSIHAAYALFVNQFLYAMKTQSRVMLLGDSLALQIGIFILLFGAYFLYCGVVLEGKTLGKKIMKLSIIQEAFVVNHLENDYHISMTQAAQRALGYMLCYLSCGTFFIFNFASEDSRGLSDYLSGTRTVSDNWLAQMLEHKEYASEEVTIDIRSLNKAA